MTPRGIIYNAVALTLVLAALLAWGGREAAFATDCTAQWCQNGRDNAAVHADVKALLMDQVTALGCDTDKRLSPRVAVVNAPERPGQPPVFDKGVVRVVPFDAAWEAATAGEVYVLGWCG
jgi:hypothetical protein